MIVYPSGARNSRGGGLFQVCVEGTRQAPQMIRRALTLEDLHAEITLLAGILFYVYPIDIIIMIL